MKRSKAVEDIKNLIELNLESLSLIPDATLTADLILTHLERVGISPPDYDNTVYGYNEGFISPPKWEPEE